MKPKFNAVPETVILEMQRVSHNQKAELYLRQEVVKESQKTLDIAMAAEKAAKYALWETALFLQTYNASALKPDENWFDELGVDKDTFHEEAVIFYNYGD